MELRLLEYFMAVAREENVSRAAASLHITQPTLSRQMRQLEDELGCVLFERSARGLTLTDAGRLLQGRAAEMLELSEKTVRDLRSDAGELSGRVSVGWGDVSSVSVLAQGMNGFVSGHPGVSFDCYTATADEVCARMERGLIDVGLLLEPFDSVKFESFRFSVPEEFVVAMAPGAPLAKKEAINREDLEGASLILPRNPLAVSELVRWFGGEYPQGSVCHTSNLTASSALMAQEGLGYALVIRGSLDSWSEDCLVCRPLSPALNMPISIAWMRGRPLSRAARAFIAYLKAM